MCKITKKVMAVHCTGCPVKFLLNCRLAVVMETQELYYLEIVYLLVKYFGVVWMSMDESLSGKAVKPMKYS